MSCSLIWNDVVVTSFISTMMENKSSAVFTTVHTARGDAYVLDNVTFVHASSILGSTMDSIKELGTALGDALGSKLGRELGAALSDAVGSELGRELGAALGDALGSELGRELGAALGDALGSELGEALGGDVGGRLGTRISTLELLTTLDEVAAVNCRSDSEGTFSAKASLLIASLRSKSTMASLYPTKMASVTSGFAQSCRLQSLTATT
jgi:hypothetical protein